MAGVIALKKGVRAVVVLGIVAITVGACGDGQRHYRGGHPLPNWFEVFSEDPLGEMRGILICLALPVAIGSIISFLWSYYWDRRSKTGTIETPRFASSLLCGIILCWLAYFLFFVAIGVNKWGYGHLSILHLVFAAIWVGPAPLIVGPVLLSYILTKQNSVKFPDAVLYGASLVALVAEYWWINELNFA